MISYLNIIKNALLCGTITIAYTNNAMAINSIHFFSDSEFMDDSTIDRINNYCFMPNETILNEMLINHKLTILLETSFIQYLAKKTPSPEDLASIIYIAIWEIKNKESINATFYQDTKIEELEEDIDRMLTFCISTDFMEQVKNARHNYHLQARTITKSKKARPIKTYLHPRKFAEHEKYINRYPMPNPEQLEPYCSEYLHQQPSSPTYHCLENPLKIILNFFYGIETSFYSYNNANYTILDLEIMLQNFSHRNNVSMAQLDKAMLAILAPITFAALLSFRNRYYYQMDLMGYQEYPRKEINA